MKRFCRFRPWFSFTKPLTQLNPCHVAQAGNKAVALGRMLQAGVLVPPGFVLSARAFQRFVQSAPEWNRLRHALAANQNGDACAIKALSERVHRALADRPLPVAVEQPLARAVSRLGAVSLWAVRSSATTEDLPEASFAGQHDSFLNVTREEIPARVRDCWLSLFSARAMHYRQRNGIRHDRAAMAVIVQQMIPADVSGVLFTADPASGNRNRIVIEAASGLGENVVGGRVSPERIVLNSSSLAVLERTSPSSRAAVERENAQPPSTSDGSANTVLVHDALATHLARLALRAEQILSGPLDVEWAVCRCEIHVLQARPITSPRVATSWEDRQVWTNLNTGEIFPDVVTPMTWSMLRLFITPLFRSIFRLFGADVTKAPTAGLVAGRAYFNVNTGLGALRPFYFALRKVPDIARALGGGQVDAHHQTLASLRDEDFPDLGFRWPKYILSWPRLLVDLITHSPSRGDAFTSRMKARGDALARLDFSHLSTQELAHAFPRILQQNLRDWDLLYLFTRAGALLVFQRVCHDWLVDRDLSLSNQLFAGLGGLPDTEAGLALWRLAVLAHADKETESVLCAEEGWQSIRAGLEQTAHGRQFLAAWNAFMSEHGHHCRGEVELFNARWSESPTYILGVVRSYLHAIDRTDPLANHERLARQRIELTEHCRRRLKNPLKRWIFSHTLRRVQRLAIEREVWKNEVVRHIAVLRRMLRTLGERLRHQGVLAHEDDIFFLEVSEIEPIGTGQASFDMRTVIRDRRREYEENLPLAPPPVVKGRYDPGSPAAPPTVPDAKVLEGVPVFPGTVTGRARVILHADNHQHMLPGEILVAPFTDPAWTPYFIPAAGVVVEQGGILSHGSIIAREYGLPSVTNVASATRIIGTGDLVRVDGNRGQVTILERVGTTI